MRKPIPQVDFTILNAQLSGDLKAGLYKAGAFNYDVDKLSSKPDVFKLVILDKFTGKEIAVYKYDDGYLAHRDILLGARLYEIYFSLLGWKEEKVVNNNGKLF